MAPLRLPLPLPWIALLTAAAVLVGCAQETPNLLRAKQIESRYELVGGPVAYADLGDFLIENDKIRVAILDTGRSWGPGVYGGSLVDADVRRNDDRFPSGEGRDRFAEVFPMTNLLVPAPLGSNVRVLHDGSDGKQATIRVQGEGYAMLYALYALRANKALLQDVVQFKEVKANVWFSTDYTLKPGESFVRMETTVRVPEEPKKGYAGESCLDTADCGDGTLVCNIDAGETVGTCACKPMDSCAVKCGNEDGAVPLSYTVSVTTGCYVCPTDDKGCSETVPLDVVRGNEPVIGSLLGDSPLTVGKPGFGATAESKGGLGGGDFLFFGKYNKQFVPGNGFDQQKAVWDAWFAGRDTFAQPFDFDWVAAVGGDVSYAYYTVKRDPADPPPRVGVPVFTSTATPFIAATKNCKLDASDDATCDSQRLFKYERFLAVGDGDVSSVAAIIERHRGTPLGTLSGYVRWQDTGGAAKNAHVAVFRDPAPGTDWQDKGLDALVAENNKKTGSPGLINAIDADRGLDIVEDGDFSAELPAGDYVVVAMDSHRVVFGDLISVKIEADRKQIVLPSLPTPAHIVIHATDNSGARIPSKATVVRLDDQGKELYADGGRRVYLGQGRIGSSVQDLAYSADGRFDIAVQAGRYRVVVSHGIEYGVHDEADFVIGPGDERRIAAKLTREIDTAGWVSGDFHLHQRPSFDSGMPLEKRVRTIAAEGVDYVAATDHDVVTDFAPYIFAASLQNWLQSAIGVEISTLDMGHFIGFPVKYNELSIPAHGAVDWYCMSSDTLVDHVVFDRNGFGATTGTDGKPEKPTTIVAHPRDGFLGWADAMGLDPFSLTRMTPSTQADNQIFRTVTCDYDAMEVFNAKRFDLIRTPTVWEIQVFERCMERIRLAGFDIKTGVTDAAAALTALDNACPELADQKLAKLTTCPANDSINDCKMRHRRSLALVINNAILTRTKDEQAAAWAHKGDKDPKDAVAKRDKLNEACLVKTKFGSIDIDPNGLDKPLKDIVDSKLWNEPCPERTGVMDDYFRLLEHGMLQAAIGGSDSHAASLEPGMPRNWIRASNDTPGALDKAELARNMRKSKVVASYGPFLDVSLAGKGPGETASVAAGKAKLKLKIQTASWFGVDRVEIYVNGLVDKVLDKELATDVKDIVDFDGEVEITVPSRDSWVVVVAMGLGEKHHMRPMYLDVPFGELQLPRLASMAFAKVPLASAVFQRPVLFPDFYPVRPYAMANAILIDTDGNGTYDPPNKRAPFCSPPCDPATGALTADANVKCTDIQNNYACLTPENRCGIDIPGTCDIYTAITKAALSDLSGHTGVGP